MLDPAVALEVEDRILVELRVVEIDLADNQLVVLCLRLGDDLAIRIDDTASPEQRMAVLDAALRGRDHEGGILIRAGLHREAMVEQALFDALRGLLRIG